MNGNAAANKPMRRSVFPKAPEDGEQKRTRPEETDASFLLDKVKKQSYFTR
ncbi:MAG: hypothetical protein K2G61_02940 [Bacteroidaceae bacterium]|nr:hypothetical protein [Bacteroidaceae bacterium]